MLDSQREESLFRLFRLVLVVDRYLLTLLEALLSREETQLSCGCRLGGDHGLFTGLLFDFLLYFFLLLLSHLFFQHTRDFFIVITGKVEINSE